ncbi:MAG TPA: cupin domain-containing protein [Thermoleophilaceae bacterium]|jgi:mannose-6-phosphate isomerase-like protein (cupin superfamily)
MHPSEHKVGPADGDRADFPNLGNRYVIRGEETGGRFALIEHTIAPRALAAPTHTHANEDEYSYVLSGRMGAMIGDEVVEAGPGDLVVKPRGIPHSFWNAGDEECRLLELISPGGFERYFADIAPFLTRAEGPDVEGLAAARERYELSMDMESVGPLVERFGLRS